MATGENPTADEQKEALDALNLMISSWSTEGLTVFHQVRESFDLTPSQASYTIGPGGDFDTTRPLEILVAKLQDQTSLPVAEFPLEVINIKQYADIIQKNLNIQIPTRLYYETAYPLGIFHFWPIPSAANKLVLYSRKPLAEIPIADISTDMVLPPGYERALKYNLAVEVAPEYGKAIPVEVAQTAIDAKANIKRQNIKPMYMQTETVLVNKKGFNILIGD